MNPPAEAARGVRVLRRLLRERTLDLRELDPAGFRGWLDRHLARWRRDPVFAQRARIRDLRRACPELRVLEREHRRAVAADEATPAFPRLRRLERDSADAGKAVEGLAGALERAAPGRRRELRRKLAEFRAKRQALEAERAALAGSSAERQSRLRIDGELRRLRAAIGLDAEEARLAALLRERGRRSGRTGESFERTAASLVSDAVMPDQIRPGGEAARCVHVLRGVTLGAARVEFDLLVVRRRAGRPVEVLAVVEAKRNINDLAHGFRLRQENLAWLTGEEGGFDPAAYRTARFRSGRFDREAVHEEGGESFPFARDSFRLFRRDEESGLFLRRLYLVTRAGPIWGVSSKALARIGHRVATDDGWEPESEAYLGRLLRWCRSLTEPIETPDVLRIYAANPRRARQVLVVGG